MTDVCIIDGNNISAQHRDEICHRTAVLKNQHDIIPGLATVLVGEDPASQIYIKNKEKRTNEVGMASYGRRLTTDISEPDLLSVVNELNESPQVHGILVQLPLPSHIEEKNIIQAIDSAKDVDGFHPLNVGALSNGEEGLVPCTPRGCMKLIQHTHNDLTAKNVVVVGRSKIVGKPLAQLLLAANCTVTIAHSHTKDIAQLCRTADILVAAVGKAEMIKGSWIKPNATVIDVGINRKNGEGNKPYLVGDVDFKEAIQIAGAITPVPGGVGPMTISCLLENTLMACCRQNGIKVPNT